MDFGCSEFSQKIINGTHEIQSEGAKKTRKLLETREKTTSESEK